MDCSSSSSTAVPVIQGDPDIFMATACGGGWALCRGLESPPLLFLPLQSWFGGGVIGDSLTAAWTSDQIEKTNCGPHTYRAPVGSVPNILGKK